MQLAFLAYLSRSGSTLLARLLDQQEEIGVTLEADFPDGLLRKEAILQSPADFAAFWQVLLRSEKFREWKLPPDEIRDALAGVSYPLPFRRLLPILVQAHLGPRRIGVYKNASYLRVIPELKQRYPDAQVICMIRDGRAIYASQRQSAHSRRGRPMTTSPVCLAREYVRACHDIDRLRQQPWFHLVRYEDLVEEPQHVIDRLVKGLGVSNRLRTGADNYAARIPAAQQHLHPLVDKPPVRDRIDAWRTALSTAEIYTIDRLAGPALQSMGYAVPPQRNRSVTLQLRFWISRLRFRLQCLSPARLHDYLRYHLKWW